MFETPRKVTAPDRPPVIPARCNVAGCDEECAVYIRKYNVARCAKHYLEDIERAGVSALKMASKKQARADDDS